MNPSGKTQVTVSLGKSTRKRIKQLKRGEGKLMDKLQDELSRLRAEGRVSADSEPVIFIVERKPCTKGNSIMSMLQMPKSKCFA